MLMKVNQLTEVNLYKNVAECPGVVGEKEGETISCDECLAIKFGDYILCV